MTDRSDDDALGYKKPPRWGRFSKGRSGNPAGRPRRKVAADMQVTRSTLSDDILRRELRRKHKVKEGGKSIDISMLEVVHKAQLAAAAKGSAIAQRDVLKRAAELEAADAQRAADAEREARRTFENIVWWREQRVKEWAAAAREGREPEEPWPHPDDIIILSKSKRRWTIRGPADEEDLPVFRYFRAERDYHFSTLVLRLRHARTKAQERNAHTLHSFWLSYNELLPKRWQVSAEHIDLVLAVFFLLPIKDLEADVRRFKALTDRLRPEPRPEHRRDIYRTANRLVQPLLKPMGYRSLAQFEHAFEQDGENMAWPRQST